MRAPDYSFIRSCLCLYCVRDTVRSKILTFPTFGCYLRSQRAFVQWNFASFSWKLHDVCRFTFNVMRCCPWTTPLSARGKCAGLDAAPPELALISPLWDQRRKRTVETSVARPQKNGDSHYGGSWGSRLLFSTFINKWWQEDESSDLTREQTERYWLQVPDRPVSGRITTRMCCPLCVFWLSLKSRNRTP